MLEDAYLANFAFAGLFELEETGRTSGAAMTSRTRLTTTSIEGLHTLTNADSGRQFKALESSE